MAHIKVVRRSMRPEEWNDLRFGWLKRYIINDKLPIDNIVIKDARQVTENNYEFYSDEFRPLKKRRLVFYSGRHSIYKSRNGSARQFKKQRTLALPQNGCRNYRQG